VKNIEKKIKQFSEGIKNFKPRHSLNANNTLSLWEDFKLTTILNSENNEENIDASLKNNQKNK
jgi:hypothetical protein